MKTIDLNSQYPSPISLALGFFDCVHLGHASLIEQTQEDAASRGIESAVLTFKNDMSAFFGGEKQIYTFDERREALAKLGVDVVIAADFDRAFCELSRDEFANLISRRFDVKSIFVGEDYTFGKNAAGNVQFLSQFCKQRGIDIKVVPFVVENGQKLSTSRLKEFVKSGDIDILNEYLSSPYTIMGEVVHGRHVGAQIGFPTANIAMSEDKLRPRDGIYVTSLMLDGKRYFGMTNIGAKPTFGIGAASVETHIFDFDGDLYGTTISIDLFKRTRDVARFESSQALVDRLTADKDEISRYFNDLNE